MRRNVLCLLALAASLCCVPAWAQQTPELNEIVVTATRVDSSVLDSPSFVTVITQKDIQESGAADLAGVLSQQSGIVVNDYGTPGQTKTVSIRGSTSSQVLVLVDGIRQNSSFDGFVDLSRIPVDNIDHIEIVQGGASSLWGTGAVGGVINIITKKATGPSIDLAITNGSYIPHDGYAVTETGSSFASASATSLFDNQKVSLSLAGKAGDVGLTGGGSFTRAANAFVWDDTSSFGDWRQRNNAQDLAQDAYTGFDLPLLGGSFSAKGSFDHSLIGVPGSVSFITSQATQEDTTAKGSFGYSTNSFFTDSLTFDLKGSYQYAQEIYDDPLSPPTSTHTTNSVSLDLTQKLAASEEVSAVYGGSASYEAANSTNLTSEKDRLSTAGFLSVPFSLLQVLTITPAIRYDYYSDFPGFLSYQFGAVLLLSETTSLKASFGSAYRVPTFSDLYWTDSYGDVGNPNLQPETSYSGELGLAFAGKRLSLEASVFGRLVFNQIDWDFTQYPATPVNISESFLPGAEVHATANVTDQFSLEADYAFIYSLLLQYLGQSYQVTDNVRVPFVPLHNLTVSGRYTNGIHAFKLALQYVSEKFIDAANTASTSLPGYVVMNAGYKIATTDSMTFSIDLLNILDTLYFTQYGYPMPPFSAELGMQLHL
ncbi:MAG: TonB-dependent receptor plug domain-containing protein [Spirochaetia bacterium]